MNCPNEFDATTGQYLPGCCDTMVFGVETYLSNFAAVVFGNRDCTTLTGTEPNICEFMSNRANHQVFLDGMPNSFEGNLWDWLKERTILVRLFTNNGGVDWTQKTNWMSEINHCSWQGVACSTTNSIVALNLQNNQLTGQFPSDMYFLEHLQYLRTFENSLVGNIPNDICDKSTASNLQIYADSTNCPNRFNAATGQYDPGCCDTVYFNVDMYLSDYAAIIFGNDNCNELSGSEINVCAYMKNKANHDIFANGFPNVAQSIVWNWLKERTVLVRMYLNNGGESWTEKNGWLGGQDHCNWLGVTCLASENIVVALNLQNNNLTGHFPTDLYTLASLQTLNIYANDLTGNIPELLCDRSTQNNLNIHADVANCPDIAECCDTVFGS